jgi:hypothetical protein
MNSFFFFFTQARFNLQQFQKKMANRKAALRISASSPRYCCNEYYIVARNYRFSGALLDYAWIISFKVGRRTVGGGNGVVH